MRAIIPDDLSIRSGMVNDFRITVPMPPDYAAALARASAQKPLKNRSKARRKMAADSRRRNRR